MGKKDMRFATTAIHGGLKPDEATGAVMTPIYQTSTYAQQEVGVNKGYEYSRTLNPTRHALEKNIAAIEGVRYGACFGSGLAAVDAVLKMLNPGDEVIATRDLYGGTYRIFNSVFKKYGIEFRFIPMDDVQVLEKHVSKKTKLIWVETPTNPMMNLVDIESVSKLAKKHDVLLAVDNTFATPYLQQPASMGADIVMHSATKYLGGHSDVVMGALAINDENIAEEIYRIQNSSGAIPGPMDCFLVLRGIKTLHVRMKQHCENARAVAGALTGHPKVAAVYWPGLPAHPGHETVKKQMRDFGGMLSFSLAADTQAAAHKLVKNTRVFTLAESLGGVESLIGHPASMTHGSIPKEEREMSGISDSLIRLSVGIEDSADLVEDLQQALDQL